MTATHTGLEDAELDGGILGRLIFQWQGDRYMHCWLCCETGEKLLESVESDHAVHWPASPPLQQVYRQSFDDGREVIFGLGMSGRGHWSASFTLVPDLKSWIVELACCSPSTPACLASTYRLLGGWELRSNSSGHGLLACKSGSTSLTLEPLSPQSVLHLDNQLLISERRGNIAPELRVQPETIIQGATTAQWGFRIRVS